MANLVTLVRVGLLLVGVGLIYSQSVTGRLTAFALIMTVILLDGADGVVARHRGWPVYHW